MPHPFTRTACHCGQPHTSPSHPHQFTATLGSDTCACKLHRRNPIHTEATTLGQASPSPYAPQRPLSRREVEVMRHIASGCDNASAGARMSISGETVRSHLLHISRKFGVQGQSSRTLLVALCLAAGVLTMADVRPAVPQRAAAR